MAKFTFDADNKKTHYEMELGDKFDFFKLYITEDNKTLWCNINADEAELLVVALQQFIKSKRGNK